MNAYLPSGLLTPGVLVEVLRDSGWERARINARDGDGVLHFTLITGPESGQRQAAARRKLRVRLPRAADTRMPATVDAVAELRRHVEKVDAQRCEASAKQSEFLRDAFAAILARLAAIDGGPVGLYATVDAYKAARERKNLASAVKSK